jgi:hypothetical protein
MRCAFCVITATTLLAACNPFDLADEASERAARGVVLPIVSQELPAPAAQVATDCIMAATSRAEMLILARDLGVAAGPQTIVNIQNIASRPNVVACFAASNIPPIQGAP